MLHTFCRSVGGLQQRHEGIVHHRSQAVAAELTDHIRSVKEQLLNVVVERG